MKEKKATQAQLEALATALPVIRSEMQVDEWEAFNEFMSEENNSGKGAKQRLNAIRAFVTRLENIASNGNASGEAE